MTEHSNLEWALAYAQAGFAVMPVWYKSEDGVCACEKGAECDRPAKHPISYHGVKHATKDQARIRAWWEEHPDANIAVATGSISEVIVIDVDTADGKEGDISITAACADRGGVPRSLKATSGSGGRHYVYKFRKNPFTRKIGFLKHVDYLSDGGYVIVQPSVNLKGAYSWDEDAGIKTPKDIRKLRAELAELPEWFDELEGAGRTGKKAKGEKKERDEKAWRARVINIAATDFNHEDPAWVKNVQEALTHCDPDSRDDWVLFGIILGREFQRNDDGWTLYSEWAARSTKFNDKGTQKLMRSYYYDESTKEPQSGSPATIATLFARAQEGGWTYDVRFGTNQSTRVCNYRPGRAIESIDIILRRLTMERESDSDTPRRIYAYGSGLGEVVEGHDYGAKYTDSNEPPNGWILRVQSYSPMSLGSRITHTVTIVRVSAQGSPSQVECPTEISTLMLTNYTKHFPRLNGIVQWPMVVDGVLAGVNAPYDPKAGLYFAMPKGVDVNGITGSDKEAKEAWKWLREVALADFPFGSDRDEAAALALLLTFMQRRAMDAAPAFLVTAPIQGSGKTTLIKFASRLVHGRSIGASSLSMVSEEQRKAITAALLTNPPALLFDNLKAGSSFDSAELAIAMTSGEWEDRKLGSTERLTLPNRAVWCFTGNNVTLKNDLRRRFVTVRMIPKSAGHYEQHFKRNIDTWPMDIKNRERSLRALLSILMWAGKKPMKLTRESGFVEWDKDVRWPVMALTGVDPVRSVTEQANDEQDDETESSIGSVMSAWAVFVGEKRATVKSFVDECAAAKKSSDSLKRRLAEEMSTAVAALREKDEQRLAPADYGYAIKMLQDRPFTMNGVSLSFAHRGLKDKVAAWELVGAAALAQSLTKDF